MAREKLVGKNYSPPDLVAKVTGKARYAEDFRAEGMLFAKILQSPMPHARVLRIDAGAALAMEGVEAILTADDLPEAPPLSERCLTNEPLYYGEPILAVAAVDETTAADAIEKIHIDLEPLPFVIDPLESLWPLGPNARTGGNIMRDGEKLETLKWTVEDFASGETSRLPMGEPEEQWHAGDLEKGFAQADLILDETLFHQSQTHHPLEPRSCMAYWQNGKLYIHPSTQSTGRTIPRVAEAVGIDPAKVVLICEYTGGGFGSKIRGSINMAIPALLAKKTGRPVMHRVSRAEENSFGRARPGFQAQARIGFRKDGRITALDLYIIQDNGPYGREWDIYSAAEMASLAFTPLSMRSRSISVLTNTPPRSAQRAPGGVQMNAMFDPLIDKAARKLGIDRVAIRRINAPDHKTKFGAEQGPLTSAYVREALDKGAAVARWDELKKLSGRRRGSKVTGVGVSMSPFYAGSRGFDGLLLIRPDGTLAVHTGVGNLGTHSFADTARVAADVLGMPWERCEVIWGDTSKHLPYTTIQAGSQTTFATTRALHAAATDARRKLQMIAARQFGGAADGYEVKDERVYSRGNRARGMSFAQAAARAIEMGGEFDGHELPGNLHKITVASARALAGRGLMGVAKDTYEAVGDPISFVVGFATVEVDVETGQVEILDYTVVADCGTVVNPRSLAAQLHGGGVQGFGVACSQKWVYDAHWGLPFTDRFYTAKPPTILDVPLEMKADAVNLPDPYTPVGARGIGEAPFGAGAGAVVCAIEDAIGGPSFNRTPIMADMILNKLEKRPQPFKATTAHV
ncbi:MAG: xanthine dehydrogenase family protein molybdopterin-binding subunit [Acidobacteria bacterium]|nr:xanthine dehydrogenase family protein molybdopterin-binding subunit [Acidobacteriota bacterium]